MKGIACSLAAALAAGSGLPAEAAAVLAAHRAVYDIALEDATDSSGITSVDGRMVYEFSGSPCEGYSVKFRFVTRIDTDETSRLTDQQTTTYEDAKGETFDFATRSFVDSQLDREVRGRAMISADATVIELVKPTASRIELEKTQFPTQHMFDLLARIERGETFYETTIFDGSDDADEVLTTTVVVGKPKSTGANDPEKGAIGELKDDRFWPVSIAYFGEPEERGEELPVYRIAFKLHANGVTRSILMDYGDFSMTGRLVDLDIFEHPADCR
jgi:hypothetical protein